MYGVDEFDVHVHRGWAEVTQGQGQGQGQGVKNIHIKSYTIIQYSTLYFMIFYPSLIG